MFKLGTLIAAVVIVGTMGSAVPRDAQAGTIYTYTGNGPTSFVITFDTSLSGAGLHNLAADTDITATLNSWSFSTPGVPFPSDTAGFPLGDNSITPGTVKIGTDAVGNITSWAITESIFASYPAFPGENPNDFFCTYSASSSGGSDSVSLSNDNDAGFCHAGFSTRDIGKWTPTLTVVAAAPIPAALPLFAAAIGGLGFLGYRRRQHGSAA